MDSIFVGSNERVIYVRHELYFEGWEALEIYFFMVLRRVFISRYNYQELLRCTQFGHAPNDSLMQLFLQYLLRTEKEVAQTALSGQKLFYLFIYFYLFIFLKFSIYLILMKCLYYAVG